METIEDWDPRESGVRQDIDKNRQVVSSWLMSPMMSANFFDIIIVRDQDAILSFEQCGEMKSKRAQ